MTARKSTQESAGIGMGRGVEEIHDGRFFDDASVRETPRSTVNVAPNRNLQSHWTRFSTRCRV